MNIKEIFQKQGGWSLIKDWLRAGILPYAISQVFLLGRSIKSLEILRLGVTLKKYRSLQHKYSHVLQNFDTSLTQDAVSTYEGRISRY